ncbi:MAG TPA: hypothetical protein VHF24_13190 [Acidimicrobiales bacterium]|nr:hypothetical protein [Acidimicrobiales bacterium]
MGSTLWRNWEGTEEGAAAAIDEEAYLKRRLSFLRLHKRIMAHPG